VTMDPSLLDTDTLSEVMKGVDTDVQDNARQYLRAFGHFTFSLITRYEILRGLKARRATRQIARFEQRCQQSVVLPITDEIIIQAADLYALLHQEGQLISDADILIAATALKHTLVMVTENVDHFRRIPGLRIESWRT
jgi:tRNA(fMet)-specific endonuclease VapC